MNSAVMCPEAFYLKSRVVAVIPCYNAGARVRSALKNVLEGVDRVILVDDGSTDGGTAGLEALPIIRITFPRNRGKGHALIAGIRHALSLPDMDAIALLDADGQHDPKDLPLLVSSFLDQQADLVVGARRLDKDQTPWRSRFGNQITARLAGRLFHCPLSDTQCGYRLLSPRFAASFVNAVPGGRYETEMLMILFAIQGGYKLLSTPVATLYEPGNKSSHFRKIRDSLRIYAALWRVLREPRLRSKEK